MDRKRYQREYHKKWYSNPKNAEAKKANAKKHRALKRARNKNYLEEYRKANPCPCGESNARCLDFHHRNPKEKFLEVTVMADRCYGLEKIQEEIDKCDLICANCHRKLNT